MRHWCKNCFWHGERNFSSLSSSDTRTWCCVWCAFALFTRQQRTHTHTHTPQTTAARRRKCSQRLSRSRAVTQWVSVKYGCVEVNNSCALVLARITIASISPDYCLRGAQSFIHFSTLVGRAGWRIERARAFCDRCCVIAWPCFFHQPAINYLFRPKMDFWPLFSSAVALSAQAQKALRFAPETLSPSAWSSIRVITQENRGIFFFDHLGIWNCKYVRVLPRAVYAQ